MISKVELLRVFVVAAQSKTFREVAGKLNMSPQSISRVIKDLESGFGEILFHRNTRTIKITKFGEELLSQASNALDVVDDVFKIGIKKNYSDDYHGKVTITTPSLIGKNFIFSAIKSVLVDYPHIEIDIRASDSLSNLIDEQIDIGIRVGHIRDNGFIVKPVNKIKFHIVGTPSLISKYGQPDNLEDLNQIPATALIDMNTGRVWPWILSDGKSIYPQNVKFSTDSSEIECQAILESIGFGQMSDIMANEYIQSGLLLPVLQKYEPEPWDLYVYRPQKGPVPGRVRVLFDHIVAHLGALDF